MNTSARRSFMPFSMMSVSSWPARPTNASPCSSSSAPGASPTNISSASGLPWPKTIVLRPPASRQRWQSPRSARIACRLAARLRRAPRRGTAREACCAARRRRPPARRRRPCRGLRGSARAPAGRRRARRARSRGRRDAARPSAARRTSSRMRSASSRFERERHVAPLAVAPQQHHGVRLAAEARARRGHVVGHDQVEVLRRELLARVREQVLGLGREADQEPARPWPRPSAFRMSGVRTSSSRSGPSVFLSFESLACAGR